MATGAAVKVAIPYLRRSYFKKAIHILVKNFFIHFTGLDQGA